jgi:hypothetical protein
MEEIILDLFQRSGQRVSPSMWNFYTSIHVIQHGCFESVTAAILMGQSRSSQHILNPKLLKFCFDPMSERATRFIFFYLQFGRVSLFSGAR